MKKHRILLCILIQGLMILSVCYLIDKFPLTGYSGLKEVRIKYYGSPVLIISSITLTLCLLEYFHILSVHIQKKGKLFLSFIALFIAIYYILIINSQIGPITFLTSIITNSYDKFNTLTNSLKETSGNIFWALYSVMIYLIISMQESDNKHTG